ncbi:hypothetical protein MNBD_ALPHA03-294 [hydrothermal vent metagenome]|uniref:COG2363 n=1 Tax=hydrothermal vent metagenome TaxID=652676 RepID=A0A3B1B8Z9_9ZZZZ
MRAILVIAALCGFFAVLFGALGAHFLSGVMTEKGSAQFKTANLYHLIHSLALFGCGLLYPLVEKSSKAVVYLKLSATGFIAGIFLFSGTLYYVAILPAGPFHYLIPLGGLFYMAGWLMLGACAFCLKAK